MSEPRGKGGRRPDVVLNLPMTVENVSRVLAAMPTGAKATYPEDEDGGQQIHVFFESEAEDAP